MMKIALVDPAGVVVGLLDWDTATTFTPPEGHVLRVTQGAHVGDVWAGTTYIPGGLDADNRAALIAKGRAYLALPTPTAAQTTKAVRALVMLALGELSDLSGT